MSFTPCALLFCFIALPYLLSVTGKCPLFLMAPSYITSTRTRRVPMGDQSVFCGYSATPKISLKPECAPLVGSPERRTPVFRPKKF